jgi:glycosyltransferase involved in cell wall biosynthesis
VASDYTRESFLGKEVPAEKLLRVNLEPPSRFRPEPRRRDEATFRVIYVGSLTVTKGVPVLLDAFRRLKGDVELVLLGGWGSRGMRRYVQGCMAADGRIQLSRGDPLDELRSADVLVHPSYSDGFGYAPIEALACGVPAVVTEDTGMKEHVREGVNGWVVPTGSADAILERLEHLRRHPLRRETASM